MSNWEKGRCPCCYKKTEIVFGPHLLKTAAGWDNVMLRTSAMQLAWAGVCPWCGRETTIVARILLRRFQPSLALFERCGIST